MKLVNKIVLKCNFYSTRPKSVLFSFYGVNSERGVTNYITDTHFLSSMWQFQNRHYHFCHLHSLSNTSLNRHSLFLCVLIFLWGFSISILHANQEISNSHKKERKWNFMVVLRTWIFYSPPAAQNCCPYCPLTPYQQLCLVNSEPPTPPFWTELQGCSSHSLRSDNNIAFQAVFF